MFFRKAKKESEMPEGMMLVSYDALHGYFSECDNVVPDYTLKAHYRNCLEESLKQDLRRRMKPVVRKALKKKK